MQFASVDGLAIHYRSQGLETGKPLIVFANSLGTDFRIWDDVAAGLASDYAILAYDKRGHGLSDLGATPYTIADHARDLAGLMDHLGLSSAIICGLSVGGQVAQQLYFDRPDLVSGLVLCDTAARIGDADFWAQRIAVIEEKGLAAVADAILTRWFTPAFRVPQNPAYALARNMLMRQPVEGYLATCAAIRDFDRRADAASITVPVHCVAGDADGSTPPALVEAFARSIPGAGFSIIAGAGHIPPVEAPRPLIEIIRTFAAKLFPGVNA